MEGTMEQPSNPAARENTHKHTLCPTHSSFRTHHTQNSPTPWVKNLSLSLTHTHTHTHTHTQREQGRLKRVHLTNIFSPLLFLLSLFPLSYTLSPSIS